MAKQCGILNQMGQQTLYEWLKVQREYMDRKQDMYHFFIIAHIIGSHNCLHNLPISYIAMTGNPDEYGNSYLKAIKYLDVKNFSFAVG